MSTHPLPATGEHSMVENGTQVARSCSWQQRGSLAHLAWNASLGAKGTVRHREYTHAPLTVLNGAAYQYAWSIPVYMHAFGTGLGEISNNAVI